LFVRLISHKPLSCVYVRVCVCIRQVFNAHVVCESAGVCYSTASLAARATNCKTMLAPHTRCMGYKQAPIIHSHTLYTASIAHVHANQNFTRGNTYALTLAAQPAMTSSPYKRCVTAFRRQGHVCAFVTEARLSELQLSPFMSQKSGSTAEQGIHRCHGPW
jgi:hypothetical protein